MTIRNLNYLFNPRSIAVIGQGERNDASDAVLHIRNVRACASLRMLLAAPIAFSWCASRTPTRRRPHAGV